MAGTYLIIIKIIIVIIFSDGISPVLNARMRIQRIGLLILSKLGRGNFFVARLII